MRSTGNDDGRVGKNFETRSVIVMLDHVVPRCAAHHVLGERAPLAPESPAVKEGADLPSEVPAMFSVSLVPPGEDGEEDAFVRFWVSVG